MQTSQLLTADTWPKLSQLTADCGKITAAIAYVTAEHLRLKKDDVLVCDASDKAIRAGMTDAGTLANLVRAKVKVYSIKGLHVKMGSFDQQVFIGSANMSANAGTSSLEATLLTTDFQVRSMVNAHIAQLLAIAEPVDARFVKRIKQLPVSPRAGPWPEYEGHPLETSRRAAQVWWLSSSAIGPRALKSLQERQPQVARGAASRLRNDVDEAVRQAAEDWVQDPESIELVVYRPSHRIPHALQRGDVLVFCHKKPSGEFTVASPVTFLTTEIVDGHQHVIYLSGANARTKNWATVESKLVKLGSSIRPTSDRVLRGPELSILDFLGGGG